MKTTTKQLTLFLVITLVSVACRSQSNVMENVSPTAVIEQEATAVPAEKEKALPTPQPNAATAQPGAVGLGDPYFPNEGNGGYDVQHYGIELSADMEAQLIDAVVTIEATAVDDLSAFNLDFKQFEITELLINDGNAHFLYEEDELTILPLEPLSAGQAFTVKITYNGQPRPSIDLGDGIPTGWF